MKLKYKCKLCDEEILTNTGLASHISNKHKLKIEEYYDRFIRKEDEGKCKTCGNQTTFIDLKRGYHTFCSKKCSNKYYADHNENCEVVCKVCNFTFTGGSKRILSIKFYNHIKTHGFNSIQEYYDKFLKKPEEGKCPICGKPTSFDNMFVGYRKYCLGFCSANKVKAEEYKQEHQFKLEKKQEKENRETELRDYIQELKDRAHEFDWNGERNTWAGGTRPKYINTKDDLITDNSISFIDGQEYAANGQCITEHYQDNTTIIENKEDADEYAGQFWL